MEDKYIKFYKTFHKGFKNNKNFNSLFHSSQSLLNKKFFLVGQEKNKNFFREGQKYLLPNNLKFLLFLGQER